MNTQNSSKSIIPSGYFGSSIDNIIVLENFIEPKDAEAVYNFAITINNFEKLSDHWDNRVLNAKGLRSNKDVYEIISKYQIKLKNTIQNKFGFELDDKSPSIVIWRPGDVQAPHADKELLDGTPVDYQSDVSSLFYWNDNYEGGEIYFPNQELKIKAKAGSAVIFPGDRFYAHGVTEVLSGKRFTSPAFWNVIKNNSNSV
jgi:predicted 2-oxoglutarate/Fe(II)-dependent dioxygenase YbiX